MDPDWIVPPGDSETDIIDSALDIRFAREEATDDRGVSESRELIVGNSPELLSPVDILALPADKLAALEHGLNERQKRFLSKARASLGGVILLHGGPQTGKSYLLAKTVAHRFAHSSEQCLLVSWTKENATELACLVSDEIDRLKDCELVVVVADQELDKNVIFENAQLHRGIRSRDGPFVPQHYCARRRDTPVNRYKQPLYLGAVAFIAAGLPMEPALQQDQYVQALQRHPTLCANPGQWQELRELHQQYTSRTGGRFSMLSYAQLFRFRILVFSLLGHVLGCAGIICTTARRARAEDITTFSSPKLIAADEMGCAFYYDIYSLIGCYDPCKNFILAGDPIREQPFLPNPLRGTPPSPYILGLELSLLERFLNLPYTMARLDKMYNYAPDIYSLLTDLEYPSTEGGIVSAEHEIVPSVNEGQPSMSDLTDLLFGTRRALVLVDIDASVETVETNEGSSKINRHSCVAVMNMVRKMLNNGCRPADIIIIAATHRQAVAYRRLRALLARTLPRNDLRELNITTVCGSITPREIAFFDLVETKPSGELSNDRKVIRGFAAGLHCLCIVAETTELLDKREYQDTEVYDLMEYLTQDPDRAAWVEMEFQDVGYLKVNDIQDA